jgi:mannosyl-3-phosphoglycerate phosphatase
MTSSMPPAIVFAGIDNLPLAIDASHLRLPALLAALAEERIILVFCSFRTRAEMEGFRQSIGVFHPFIVENGSAVFVPRRYFGSDLENARAAAGYQAIEFGLGYDLVVERVRRTAEQYRLGIRGFADMSIEQVARECGLSLLDARLAKLREYAEPFRLLRADPVAERRLMAALESSGIWCTRHGAFLHAASVFGPAAAASVLTTLDRAAFGSVLTVAAGGNGMANVMGRVDVALDSMTSAGRAHQGETLAWIENIVEGVRAVRQMGMPPFATATMDPTSAWPH